MEKGFKLSKSLKKLLICGASVMMLAGVGATAGSQIAQNNNGTEVTAHASTSNYRHIMNYLHWVQRYNHTHEHNIHTWKLAHMYYYMSGLNYWETKSVKNTLNRYHTWYYSNDNSMDTLMNKINDSHKVVYHSNWRARRAFMNKRNNQYNNVNRYLRWVNWFDAHHAHKFTSWKLRHLTNYMSYLSAGQKANFTRQANHFNNLHDYPVRISRRSYRIHHAVSHHAKQASFSDNNNNVANNTSNSTSNNNNTATNSNDDNSNDTNNINNQSNDNTNYADLSDQDIQNIMNADNHQGDAQQAELRKEDQEASVLNPNDPTIHEHTNFKRDPYFGKTPVRAFVTKGDYGQPIVEQDFNDGAHVYYGAFNNGTVGLNDYNNFKKYQQSNPIGAKAWLMNNANFSGKINE